jgi:hypothetical protein
MSSIFENPTLVKCSVRLKRRSEAHGSSPNLACSLRFLYRTAIHVADRVHFSGHGQDSDQSTERRYRQFFWPTRILLYFKNLIELLLVILIIGSRKGSWHNLISSTHGRSDNSFSLHYVGLLRIVSAKVPSIFWNKFEETLYRRLVNNFSSNIFTPDPSIFRKREQIMSSAPNESKHPFTIQRRPFPVHHPGSTRSTD